MTKEKREQIIEKTKAWVKDPRTLIFGAAALSGLIIGLTTKKKLTTENVKLKQAIAAEVAKNIVLTENCNRLGKENANCLYTMGKQGQQLIQAQLRRGK